ncbi:alcohol dehydrogenase catalytic domain-containing protein [Candidatus Poribacteria bacterium]|nr:alcohol dehydrogenase catalytic domain-containing protein [Candidatus Poribacteria bacterium]
MLSVYFDVTVWKIALTQALARVSKNALWGPLSPLRMGELPEPALPGPEWVKVRVHSCGLCGSDMHLLDIDINPRVSVAAVPGMKRIFLGHELYCEVVETGRDVKDIKKGDKLSYLGFFPNCKGLGNNPCPPCAEGNYTLCLTPEKGTLPSNRGGGFSEFMVAHRSQWAKLPDDFTEDQALMTEPLAVAVHAVFKHPPKPGDRVLVIGAGTVGLNVLQVVKAVEPRAYVTALARYPQQEQMALRLGADKVIRGGDTYRAVADDTGGRLFNGIMGSRMMLGGYDVIHDSVGSGATFQDALRWVKGHGAIVLSGVQLAASKIDFTPIWHQEINVTGINCHGQEHLGGTPRTSFEWAIELIRDGKAQTAPLISHRFPLRDIRQAIEAMKRKGEEPTFKIVLDVGKEKN